VILDPFCGVGTVLAVANRLGLDAVGVEKNRKRAEDARALTVRADEDEGGGSGIEVGTRMDFAHGRNRGCGFG